jgi:hypothetical protein
MHLRAGSVVLGLVLIAGTAWYAARDPIDPARERARRERADKASAEIAADAMPALYRWRDDKGVLHVAQEPPVGLRYERIPRDTGKGDEVRGDRR